MKIVTFWRITPIWTYIYAQIFLPWKKTVQAAVEEEEDEEDYDYDADYEDDDDDDDETEDEEEGKNASALLHQDKVLIFF